MTCRARSPEGRIVCKSIQNTSLTSPDTNYYQIDQVRTHLVTFGPVLDHVSGPNPFDSCVFSIQNVSKNRPDGRTNEHTHTWICIGSPHNKPFGQLQVYRVTFGGQKRRSAESDSRGTVSYPLRTTNISKIRIKSNFDSLKRSCPFLKRSRSSRFKKNK